jgi:hypothetical protein
VLTIATQSWHPLGTRFAEEQQSFADLGEVQFVESRPSLETIKRWNGSLHWLPGLVAWYRQEDYARIDRYVGGNPASNDFERMTCNVDAHDPVLSIKVETGTGAIPAIATVLEQAQIRSRSLRAVGDSQIGYAPVNARASIAVDVTDFNFPFLHSSGYSTPTLEQCTAWWIPARSLKRVLI